jgi:signal transduction histidine kinase
MSRQRFISEASRILAESLDYEATLQSVARLAVCEFAEWCVVELVQADGSMARVAIEHKSGAPQSFVDVANLQPERLQLLRRLGLQACISAPLVARGRVLGTITLFSELGRAFGPDDVAMAEDLARRSAIAIDNARLHEEAQRALRSRDEMLAIISHDLRTPLSAIMMAAELQIAMAARAPGAEQFLESAETCRRAAQHLCRLIGDLTDMSHIDAGRLAVERRPHDTEQLLREVVDTLRPIAAERGTFLTLELIGELGNIECDRDRIIQVFSNLVMNAVNVGAPSVTLRAENAASGVAFCVEDTGPGLSTSELSQMFDRYWRGGSAHYRGTGLGLPIAKAIVDAHDSHLDVSSTPGVGTTFSFTLASETSRDDESFGAIKLTGAVSD